MQNAYEMIRTTSGIFQRWGNVCSDMQRSALKLSVNTLRILFNLQEAETRKPWSIRFMIVQYFELYFGSDLLSVDWAFCFWFTLCRHVPAVRYNGLP